jgi:hypothetical protein
VATTLDWIRGYRGHPETLWGVATTPTSFYFSRFFFFFFCKFGKIKKNRGIILENKAASSSSSF